MKKLEKWHESGGVLLIGYEMFKRIIGEKKESKKYLLNPGADLVVFDEGHKLKSRTLYTLTSDLRTRRRIAITGKVIIVSL